MMALASILVVETVFDGFLQIVHAKAIWAAGFTLVAAGVALLRAAPKIRAPRQLRRDLQA